MKAGQIKIELSLMRLVTLKVMRIDEQTDTIDGYMDKLMYGGGVYHLHNIS